MKSLKNATKWGDRESAYIKVTDPLKKFVFQHLGMDPDTLPKKYTQKKTLDAILRESRLSASFQSELKQRIDKAQITTDPWTRITNSLGQGYVESLRSRFSDLPAVVDLVVFPHSHEEIVKIIQIANKFLVPLSTVAGATSVTLGIEPSAGIVAVNLTQMNKILEVNPEAQYITVESGILGPELEAQLKPYGVTLGHFPQSFEYSTVGGWAATRGAGQNSTLYGKIEDMVMGIKFVTGLGGTLITKKAPARATGPDINHILLGSEGTFGIITEMTLRVWKTPKKTRLSAFFFKSFEEGLLAYKEILQNGYCPAVMRISDSEETHHNIVAQALMHEPPKMPFSYRMLLGFLEKRGYKEGTRCMGVLSFEGDPPLVNLSFKQAKKSINRHKGVYLGSRPAKSWYKRRYELPFIRDPLIDHGILIETFETSTTWDNIVKLYRKTRKILKPECPILWTHGSHFYPNGANLYFTLVAPQEENNEFTQYYRIRKQVLDAFQTNGGTLSHHHGVGRSFITNYPAEIGKEGLTTISSIKDALDPNKIMNPGIFGLSSEKS
ncbi:MAG: FAD-binding oxidoreductase [Candidatus Hodarchaeales archaeon]|jgi:alkyldihydroxyacetonephosphate synthase